MLIILNKIFGVEGIVWTQAVADTFTVIVSYAVYAGIRKREGWPVRI